MARQFKLFNGDMARSLTYQEGDEVWVIGPKGPLQIRAEDVPYGESVYDERGDARAVFLKRESEEDEYVTRRRWAGRASGKVGDSMLHKKLIRLAYQNPGPVRDALMPLLREGAAKDTNYDQSTGKFLRPAHIRFDLGVELTLLEEIREGAEEGDADDIRTMVSLNPNWVEDYWDSNQMVRDAIPSLVKILRRPIDPGRVSFGETVASFAVKSWRDVQEVWQKVQAHSGLHDDMSLSDSPYVTPENFRLYPDAEYMKGNMWGRGRDAQGPEAPKGSIDQWLRENRPR